MWKKNGALQSFIDGGNKLAPTHLQAIEKAGAVPTSVLGSIQSDIRSSNPQIQARGVENLRAIKSHSARTQTALYRDLPDDFAGVINRLDSGWSTKEALTFLTRPRDTPDVEKKLKTEAGKKTNLEEANKVLRSAKLEPTNMSTSVRDQLHTQWEDAFARAKGDPKLAADLYKQDIAKNRKVGVSTFTNKVEQYPITNFAPKQTITDIVNEQFPETKGKEFIPVFSGLKRIDGEEQPTYDIFIKEDGNLSRITNEGRQFYTTREEVAAIVTKQRDAAVDVEVQKALKRKADTQAAIDRNEARGGVAALRARKQQLDAQAKQ